MRVGGLLPLAAMLSVALAQTTVTVRVGSQPLGEVPALATGAFNYGNSMLVVGFEEEFEAVRVEALRFPPGNQADEIEVGRHDLAALLQNLDLLGMPRVLMVANLFDGSPAQAAGLARLAESMEIPILAWEIGNEPDLYASNRSDPSWTPERYCSEFRQFAAALREVDPDYLFAGPAVSGARPGAEEYLKQVLRLCGDAIDILTWHVYPTDGTWPDEAALATSQQFGEELRRYRQWSVTAAGNPRGHHDPPLLGVTEFGLSWRSSSFRHLEDMTATLWLADVLGQMTRERLDLSNYFTLQGMGGHGLIDSGGWVRPTYHLYRMLATFTGEAVEVAAEGPLKGYGVSRSGERELLLINPSGSSFAADLTFEGGTGHELQVSILSERIFDELLAPLQESVPVDEPLFVPGRAVVLVRTTDIR